MKRLVCLLVIVGSLCMTGCDGSNSNNAYEDAGGFTKQELSEYSCEICGSTAEHAIEGLGAENGGYDYEFVCDKCFNEMNDMMREITEEIENER